MKVFRFAESDRFLDVLLFCNGFS